MSDAYDWADDASRCYDLAIKTLRDRYLKERLEGETAAHWEARNQSRRILEKAARILRKKVSQYCAQPLAI